MKQKGILLLFIILLFCSCGRNEKQEKLENTESSLSWEIGQLIFEKEDTENVSEEMEGTVSSEVESEEKKEESELSEETESVSYEMEEEVISKEEVIAAYKEFISQQKYRNYDLHLVSSPQYYCIWEGNGEIMPVLFIREDDFEWQMLEVFSYDIEEGKVVYVDSMYAYGVVSYSPSRQMYVYSEIRPTSMTGGSGFYQIQDLSLHQRYYVGWDSWREDSEDMVPTYYFFADQHVEEEITEEEKNGYFADLISIEPWEELKETDSPTEITEVTEENLFRGYHKFSTAEDVYNKESVATDITGMQGYGYVPVYKEGLQMYELELQETEATDKWYYVYCEKGELFGIEAQQIMITFCNNSEHYIDKLIYTFPSNNMSAIGNYLFQLYGDGILEENILIWYSDTYKIELDTKNCTLVIHLNES